MAFVIAERVRETTLTTGTGTIDLAGATLAMRTFVAGIGTGNTTRYLLVSGNGIDWEIGTGTVTDASPDTLTRTPEISTNSNAAISLIGESRVLCVYPASLDLLLDTLYSTTRGSVLYRGASKWLALAPGSQGQALIMGASDPAWGAATERTTLVFSSSGSTLAGIGNVFPTTAALAITADDVYEFEACIKGWDGSHNCVFLIMNNAKTQAYRWIWQSDGNTILDNYDGSQHVLRASGGNLGSAPDIAIIRGVMSFGSAHNTVIMENLGSADLGTGDAHTLMAGTSIYFGASCSANTFSNILKCSIRKLNP